MSVSRIASRYAKSLVDLAVEQNILDRVLEDVESFQKLVKENKDFRTFLKSPIIQFSKKKAVLNQLFEGKYSDLTLKFITLLAQKQREAYLPEVATHFISQYRDLKHISIAKVTSAVPLTEEMSKTIKEKLEASGVSYEHVEIQNKVNPDLIGGFILEFGDYVYDSSVAHKLEQLKKQFTGNLYESRIIAR